MTGLVDFAQICGHGRKWNMGVAPSTTTCHQEESETLGLANRHQKLPSSSAPSDALWTLQSFSPPLSECQTAGCESARCSPVLQPKVAKWITLDRAETAAASCSALWVDLRAFNCSNDDLKVLKKKKEGRKEGRIAELKYNQCELCLSSVFLTHTGWIWAPDPQGCLIWVTHGK